MNQNVMFDPFATTAIKTLVWGKLPAGKAGSKLTNVKLTLTAKGSNGKAITGTYPSPITLTDTDKSGATKLLVNGKAATNKNPVKKSTDKITLTYSGLAITPATFQAASKGVKKPAKATFAPTLAGIVYAGPTVSSVPEVDLTSTTAGQTGYSASFTASQLGWTGSYGKKLTYALSAVAGFTNNCATAYAITPASGAATGAFTVSGAATAVAGECSMAITGGAGKSISVLLTFTTTSVGVNGKQAPNR